MSGVTKNIFNNGKMYLSIEMMDALEVEAGDLIFMRLKEGQVILEKHKGICHICGVKELDSDEKGICYACKEFNFQETKHNLYGTHRIQKPRVVHISKRIRDRLKTDKLEGMVELSVTIEPERIILRAVD